MTSASKLRPGHVVGRGVKLDWETVQIRLSVSPSTTGACDGWEGKVAGLSLSFDELIQNFPDQSLSLTERGSVQPDGSYRFVLTTANHASAHVLANTLAAMVSNALGKNTVRVVVTSANETLCEIAA